MGTFEAYGSTVINGTGDSYREIAWDDWNALTPEQQQAIPKAVITDVPGVNGKISTEFLKTLWVNPSPNSAFAAQNITLASDDYDFLMFEYKISTTDQRHMTTIVKKGESARMYTVAPSSDYPVVLLTRDANYVSNVSYSVSTASAAIGSAYQTNDIFLLPLAIYGFKKNIEFDLTAVVANVSTSADKCMMSDGVTSVEDKLGDIDTTLSSLGVAATKGVSTTVQSGDNNLVTSNAVNTKVNSVVSAMGIYETEVANNSVPNATNFCTITLPAGTYIAVAVYQSSDYPYAYITTNPNKPQIYSNVDVFTLSKQTTIGLAQGSGATKTYSYAHLVALKIK